MTLRLNEIETRLKAISTEIAAEGADLAALEAEADKLIEERTLILKDNEKRKAILSKVGAGNMGEGMPVVKTEERTQEYGADSPEYRSAFLKHIRNIELNEVESRAFTSASNSAGAVIPTQTANEIIKKMKQHAPLLDEITLLQVKGNVNFAVEGTKADAALHTENDNITASTDALTTVSLGSYEVTKLIQISKTVNTMSIDAFEGWLTDMIAEKISEKINYYLIYGTGSSQPQGIDSANTWGDTNSITVAKTGNLTAANVQSLIGLLDGIYDKNAKFRMSKKTLFNDFMPLQDNSKNSIVKVEGHEYFVYGYPVKIESDITFHEAYLGDAKKVVGNLSEAINIVCDFDVKTNSMLFLGCAMFDSQVADDNAFVKLIKATA